MKKIIGILMALCILTVLVSSANACIPGTPGCITPPVINTRPNFVWGDFNAGGTAGTTGIAYADGYCPTAQVATNAGTAGSSVFSITNAAASGYGAYASAAGGSGVSFTFK